MHTFSSSKRFTTQILLAFLLFTLGTTLGLGIPATLLIGQQTDLFTEALLDQAEHTTQALLQNKTVQLQNLAILITERPTLSSLIQNDFSSPELGAYLDGILLNSGLDGLLVCSPAGGAAAVGDQALESLCQTEPSDGFILLGGEIWLLASAELATDNAGSFKISVGNRADLILSEFSQQSGLEYLILLNDTILADSIAEDSPLAISIENLPQQSGETSQLSISGAGGISHLAENEPLAYSQDLQLISLLNIEEFTANSRQLGKLIYTTLAAISLLGAGLAVVISRRISHPLIELADAAAALRGGDLQTPLFVPSKVMEVNQLTNALEDARVSLQHSLEQLQGEKAWIENMLNSIVEGLVALDDQNRITFASDGIARILGEDSSVIIGRMIDDYFIPAESEIPFSDQLPAPQQTRRISAMINEHEILLSVSASDFIPPEAGNANRALVIRDISDEERIHRLMGEFMANITHEFRTPLAALAASVELLLEQLPSLTSEEIEHLLHSFNVGIINLQALIDNLLEAASIEAGRFKVTPYPEDLNEIITKAVETVGPIASKHNLEIKHPKSKKSIRVLADKGRTTQVMVNLLSNAIKHSPDQGVIEITTLIVEKKALIEVRDQGKGVPPNRRGQLFSRFSKSPTEGDPSQPGFGLGLSVVKAIVEAQYGEVGYRENESGGARFWFTLPLAKAEAE